MSEEPNGSSGAPGDNPEGNPGSQNANPEGGKPDTVSRKAYEKALSEKRNAQERLRQLETDAETRKREDLERDGNLNEKIDYYKNKAEESQTQISDLNSKIQNHDDRWKNASKLTAFREALPGQFKNEGYWDLVDLSKIIVDPEGNIEKASVQKYVDEFTSKYPDTVMKANHPNSPNEFPGGGGTGTLTLEAWKKLPYKEKIKRQGEIAPE